jgi:hypothetical protein
LIDYQRDETTHVGQARPGGVNPKQIDQPTTLRHHFHFSGAGACTLLVLHTRRFTDCSTGLPTMLLLLSRAPCSHATSPSWRNQTHTSSSHSSQFSLLPLTPSKSTAQVTTTGFNFYHSILTHDLECQTVLCGLSSFVLGKRVVTRLPGPCAATLCDLGYLQC